MDTPRTVTVFPAVLTIVAFPFDNVHTPPGVVQDRVMSGEPMHTALEGEIISAVGGKSPTVMGAVVVEQCVVSEVKVKVAAPMA